MNQMELRLYAEKVARLERAERTIGEQLREANQRLAHSEEQFRDLFEEAPIAYVHQACRHPYSSGQPHGDADPWRQA